MTLLLLGIAPGLLSSACRSQCDEEQSVVLQTWDVDTWAVLDSMPAEPRPPTPSVEGVLDTAAFDDLAEGLPRETTWLHAGALEGSTCGPYRNVCYSYELVVPLADLLSPGEYRVFADRGVPIGFFLSLYTRDPDITELDPGTHGAYYFQNTPGTGTVWVDEFGPDVKLRYDVTFDNGEGRIRHVVGSLETERSVQCVAD